MTTSQRRRPRNPVARSPLLRKGGVHEKSKSGLRANAKQDMLDEASQWREALADELLTEHHSRLDAGNDLLLNVRLIQPLF